MRAWAAISVAAVLVALPMSVERAAGDPVVPDAASPAVGGVTAAAVPPTNLGVMLWLSVAVLAMIAACLVLHRSRIHLAPAADVAPLPLSNGGPSGGSDDAAPSAPMGA
jgi:hypothetical protein